MLNAVATAAYIGVHLGPGPRDGLMTGLVGRTGRSVRLVRTSIEVVVVATGWLLGGTLGVGTVLYAVASGPLVQIRLPRRALTPPRPADAPPGRRPRPASARREQRADIHGVLGNAGEVDLEVRGDRVRERSLGVVEVRRQPGGVEGLELLREREHDIRCGVLELR